MSDNCVFCKIVQNKISTKKVYEDDELFAFFDISPQAPIHILLITKKHIVNILEFKEIDYNLFVKMLKIIEKITTQFQIKDNGFRIVINTGMDGGQTVEHVHFHILGGRFLNWPPG